MEGFYEGASSRDGRFVFPACDGHLIVFENREDVRGTLVRSPTFESELPSAWAVDDYRQMQRSAARSGGFIPPQSVEEYANTPKSYSGMLRFDHMDRLWALTNRNRYDSSYLDIYIGIEFVASVRLQDRVEAFDIMGNTLAALAIRPARPPGPDGLPDRQIHWYDISGLDARPAGVRQAPSP